MSKLDDILANGGRKQSATAQTQSNIDVDTLKAMITDNVQAEIARRIIDQGLAGDEQAIRKGLSRLRITLEKKDNGNLELRLAGGDKFPDKDAVATAYTQIVGELQGAALGQTGTLRKMGAFRGDIHGFTASSAEDLVKGLNKSLSPELAIDLAQAPVPTR